MMGKKRQAACYQASNTTVTRLFTVGITTVGGMVALT
jgi:hypothetical protein